jgi:hypothetical protein
MLFSAQPFSSTPFSGLTTDIMVSYNGEYLGFTLSLARNSGQVLGINRDVSFELVCG